MIVLIGTRSRIYTSFSDYLRKETIDFLNFTSSEFFQYKDLTDEDVVINFSSKGVRVDDRVNESKESIWNANYFLEYKIASVCKIVGAKLIHLGSELESETQTIDEYVASKKAITQKLLDMSDNGLKVICLLLPSIVGFFDRPGFIEDIFLKIANKDLLTIPRINRKMIHAEQLNEILLFLIKNQLWTKGPFKINSQTQIRASSLESFLSLDLHRYANVYYLYGQHTVKFDSDGIEFFELSEVELIELLISGALKRSSY